jgi:hypothetical protein
MENLSNLQTGDILLFKGNWWYSRIIESLGMSNFSHTGLILRDPTYIRSDLKGLYILQSGLGLPDDINGKARSGVQLNKLEDDLKIYNQGDVFVRHLTAIRDERFYRIIANIYQEHMNDPYDTNFVDWVEAKILLDDGWSDANCLFPWNNARKDHSFWCSAFLAFIFCRLGLLADHDNLPYTLIAPKDWSSAGNELKFKACKLDPEMELRLN